MRKTKRHERNTGCEVTSTVVTMSTTTRCTTMFKNPGKIDSCVPRIPFRAQLTVAVLSSPSVRLSQPRVLYISLSDGPAVWVETARPLVRRWAIREANGVTATTAVALDVVQR